MSDQEVYRLCPCGSGKKIKFCCLPVVNELARVDEFVEREQHDKAVAFLEGVLKKGISDKAARTGLRLALIENLMRLPPGTEQAASFNQRVAEQLQQMLKDTPEHPSALALDALVELRERGWPACQKKFHRFLQKVGDGTSSWGTNALFALGDQLSNDNHPLAGLKYTLRGLELSAPEDRRVALQVVTGLTRDPSVLFPLRIEYPLREIADLGALQPQFDSALQLTRQGFYSDAAKAFLPIARERRNDPAIWWNIGLCHAWAAEEPLAVKALTASAANDPDPESAAETLVLARLLDAPTAETGCEVMQRGVRCASLGRLMQRLEGNSRIMLVEAPHEHDHDSPAMHEPHDPSRVTYSVLAEPLPPEGEDRLVRLQGTLVVYNRPAEAGGPTGMLLANSRADDAALKDLLSEAAGSELSLDEEAACREILHPEVAVLLGNYYRPNRTPAETSRLRRESLALQLEEWRNTAQTLLQGKTPRQAMGVPELAIPLRAAVVVAQATLVQLSISLDVEALRQELQLPPTPRTSVTIAELGSLNPLALRRLDYPSLADDTLLRASLIAETSALPQMVDCLAEIRGRTSIDTEGRLQQTAGHMLAELLHNQRQHEKARDLLRTILEEARQKRAPLQQQVMWELRLLTQSRLLEDQNEVQQIALRIWHSYVPKLPELKRDLVNALRNLVEEGPWHGSDGPIELPGGGVPGQLWTPDSEAAAPAKGKLWLPGAE
ncbi:MAG: SEC-C domain-containing protein [Planctomycetaceae bacterium]